MTILIEKNASKEKIEAAIKLLEKKNENKNMRQFYGKLKGVFENGLDYQRKVRGEWNGEPLINNKK